MRLLLLLLQVALCWVLFLLLLWQALVIGVIRDLPAFLAVCGCGILIFFTLIAVHELGHLVAGWVLGLRFERLTLGPLIVARETGQIRTRLNTAWFQPAALVKYAWPRNADEVARWAMMVLAGPLINVFIGVVCLAAASWLNPGPPSHMASSDSAGWRSVALLYPGDLPTAVLNVAGILSLGLGLSVVPGSAAGMRTDGGILLDLWRYYEVAQTIGRSVAELLFVVSALGEICEKRRREQKSKGVQVSAREFCDYLLICRGEETAALLRALNLRRSEDVGLVVFALVNAGLIGRREADSEEDFKGLFALQ